MAIKNMDKLLGIKRFEYKDCIGIYISPTDVYVAQIVEKSGGIEIDSLIKLAVGEIAPGILKPAELNEAFFANPAYWIDPIKKIIENRKWNSKNVIVSLAPNFAIHRHFVIQDMPRKYWKQAIPLQARKYIHYPFEHGVYDYYVYPFFANLSKTKRLGIVFSLTSKRIVNLLESGFKSLGLNLISVETSPFSIYRLFSQTDKENVQEKGCIYSNFTETNGQFLFAINNVPVLMREVEIQRSLGLRNRLEINNSMDFISKQLEKNPFEDIAVISDDGDFWAPIVENDVKRNVRIWKISDIFGFKVEGFAEIAAIGACLKFINTKVPDVDLYKRNRSSEEEIRGTLTIWKLAAMIFGLFLLWTCYVQVSTFLIGAKLKAQQSSSAGRVTDFRGLSSEQIENKVSAMSSDVKTLSTLMHPVSYTEKLSALPGLLPDDMWLSSLSINYPYSTKSFKEKNNLSLAGVVSSLKGTEKDLAIGNAFRIIMDNAPKMADICKGQAKIDYAFAEGEKTISKKDLVVGMKFTLRCEKESE